MPAALPEPEPTTALNITETWDDGVLHRGEPDDVIPWTEVRDRIARAGDYWVTTVRVGAAPHVRPVFAVWVAGHLVSTTNDTRAKARHLRANPEISFATRVDGVDVVVEGRAEWVADGDLLEAIAEEYRSKYGWPLKVSDGGGFDAPFAAPAAGPPPYLPYAVRPRVVYALGTTDELAPLTTKYTFESS